MAGRRGRGGVAAHLTAVQGPHGDSGGEAGERGRRGKELMFGFDRLWWALDGFINNYVSIFRKIYRILQN